MNLTSVSTSGLERLRDALRAGRLQAPVTRADLAAFGFRDQLETVLGAFASSDSTATCLAIVEVVLAERARFHRPPPELVWTGPEGAQAQARDTAVVLRELFEGAQRRVVLAGYTFFRSKALLQPLHAVMISRGVQASFFVGIEQVQAPVADPNAYAQEVLGAFVRENWDFGPPYPEVYCDVRALSPGPPWCSMHAKCVVVDGERSLVSSANFTERAQDRNIETGVLLHDPVFGAGLERQWFSLVDGGLVVRWGAA